jgi:hypothetical protein
MHDETPGGQAVKDRTLALWRDLANAPQIAIQAMAPRPRANKTGIIETWKSLVTHYVQGIDVFLNGGSK